MATVTNSLTAIRFYTDADPYSTNVDNRPLLDLVTNQNMVAGVIDTITLGRVDVTGAGSPTTNAIPTGWTVTRNSAGNYTITHNLNTLAYSVGGTCFHATTPYVLFVTNYSLNTFTVSTVNLSGTATDVRFVAHLTRY